MIFPNGIHSGTYWFEEINCFRKNGGEVLNWGNALIYEKYDYVFDKFVDYFNTFRQKGGSFKILGKLIINSLYGKLGSGIKDNKYLIAYNKEEVETYRKNVEIISIVNLNNIFILETKDKTKMEGINVGLAACITSKARVKLVESMIEIEKKGGRMLYCDTDSLFVEFEKDVNFDLFPWDKKDSIYDAAVFALPKSYALLKNNVSEVKIKGIPRSSIDFHIFRDKFINNEILVFNELMQTKKADFKLRSGNIEKKIDLSIYNKRKFNEDKTNTHV